MSAVLLALAVGLFAVAYVPLRDSLALTYRIASPLPDLLAAGAVIIVAAVLRIPIERLFSAPGRRRVSPAQPRADGLNALIQLTDETAHSLPATRLLETRSIIRGIVRTLLQARAHACRCRG